MQAVILKAFGEAGYRGVGVAIDEVE